jgi:hypothetical protein
MPLIFTSSGQYKISALYTFTFARYRTVFKKAVYKNQCMFSKKLVPKQQLGFEMPLSALPDIVTHLPI